MKKLTNKEKEMTRLLQLLNILALVYKIKVLTSQLLEVGNAVGYALELFHHSNIFGKDRDFSPHVLIYLQ